MLGRLDGLAGRKRSQSVAEWETAKLLISGNVIFGHLMTFHSAQEGQEGHNQEAHENVFPS
jgi:hypothetical protein